VGLTEPLPMGSFDLLEFIGAGAMGQVWHARHRAEDTPVAIKVITEERASFEDFQEQFRQEVRAVAGLRHPGIVKVFDYGEVPASATELASTDFSPASPYLAMELCPRGSLAALDEQLPWSSVRSILLSLLDALAHAHARGVIHRDLKPSNILLAEAGDAVQTRLTDFGLAFLASAPSPTVRKRRAVCGTPAYMPPEQLMGHWRDLGPWSDLYGLGCLAYELTCGRPPYQGRSIVEIAQMHLHKELPPLNPLTPVPEAFERWIHRLLQKDPAARFRNAADAAWGLMLMETPQEDAGQAKSTYRFSSNRRSLLLESLDELADGPVFKDAQPIQEDASAPMELLRAPMPSDWRQPENSPRSPHLMGAGQGLYGLRRIPLVGRHEQRDLLWQELRTLAQAPWPRAVVINGPSGVGKSRLAQWLCERAGETGAANNLRTTPGADPTGMGRLAEMLAGHFQTRGLPRAKVRSRLGDWLCARGVEDPYEAEALTEILSPATEADLDEGQRKTQFSNPEQRYGVIARTLGRLAEQRPLVVWLDDVHASLDAVEFVRYCLDSEQVDDRPLLFVATLLDEALTEEQSDSDTFKRLFERPDVLKMPVARLADHEHAELVEELLLLDPALSRRVADRSAGNPLFAVQLVGDWIDRGVLELADGGFALRDGEQALIPDNLYDIWASRLDEALTDDRDDAQLALELAATIGLEVDDREWRVACDIAGYDFPKAARERLLAHKLFNDTDRGVRFVHGMLRECLERRARQAERWREHNRVAAQMVEELHGEHPEIDERLGRHLFAAEHFEAALAPLMRAIRRRGNQHDIQRTLLLIDMRGDAIDQLGLAETSRERLENELMQTLALNVLRRIDDATSNMESILERARQCGDPWILAKALYTTVQIEEFRGSYGQALEWLDECMQIQGICDEELQAQIRARRGFFFMRRADFDRAIDELNQALHLSQALGAHRIQGRALSDLGECEFRRGHPQRAKRLLREAAEEYRRGGYDIHAIETQIILGDIARHEGDLDEAENAYQFVLERAQNTSQRVMLLARINLALVHVERREFGQALIELQDLERRHQRRQSRVMLTCTRCIMLPALAAKGRWADFEQKLLYVERSAAHMGLYDLDLATTAEIAGDIASRAGRHEYARAALDFAVTQWEGLDKPERAAAARDKIAQATA
jgi:eukaryotic-like serine/threonine-protein kinase